MNLTVINDCRDENAKGRQLARLQGLFGIHANFIGVETDLEAAGNCIDALDALQNESGLILMNVAPRHGLAKKHENGSPFGYAKVGNKIVVSTVDGLAFSLIKKFKLADHLIETDIHEASKLLADNDIVSKELASYLARSQFRSYDYLPFAGYALSKLGELPGRNIQMTEIADAPNAVWWIDNFGNAKTTLTKSDISISKTGTVNTKFGELNFVEQLKDVPDGSVALIEGSSGLLGHKFLELVVQGGSAKTKFGLERGSLLF